MKKAAIYVRVSTNYQVDKDSLPLQRQDMINYAKYALNIEEYEVFEDAGFSGKNTKRPAFQDMLKRIKAGEFTHLLVWKIDRISRNLIDFCSMYEELKEYNCTFVSKNEQFDTSSAMGETMLKIILVFAELERKLTGERVTAVMIDRGKKGLWNGAPVPLGYKWSKENKFPIIDEDEAITIRMIYELYAEHKSTSVVRNTLNDMKFRTKRGGTWNTKTVGDILRNPFYKGTYRYNYRSAAGGKKKDKSEWIFVDDNHPAIISTELWKKCNDTLDVNALRCSVDFRSNVKPHVFSGLLKCDECARSLHASENVPSKDGFRSSFYVCSGRYNHNGCSQKIINDNVVGNFVLNLIKNFENLKSSIPKEDIEKILLAGKTFKNISLALTSIDDLYDLLKIYKSTYLKSTEVAKPKNQILQSSSDREKIKLERALSRLEDLYLFDEAAITQKDYLTRKKEIQDKIESINKNSKKVNINTSDDEIIKRLHQTYILLEFKKNEEINYKKFIRKTEKSYLKEIVNKIIKEIFVRDKKVISIEFKNGLKMEFSHL